MDNEREKRAIETRDSRHRPEREEGHREKRQQTQATERKVSRDGAVDTERETAKIDAREDRRERGCGKERRRAAAQQLYILGSLGIFEDSHGGISGGW